MDPKTERRLPTPLAKAGRSWSERDPGLPDPGEGGLVDGDPGQGDVWVASGQCTHIGDRVGAGRGHWYAATEEPCAAAARSGAGSRALDEAESATFGQLIKRCTACADCAVSTLRRLT